VFNAGVVEPKIIDLYRIESSVIMVCLPLWLKTHLLLARAAGAATPRIYRDRLAYFGAVSSAYVCLGAAVPLYCKL
jgi:hypothetical protein